MRCCTSLQQQILSGGSFWLFYSALTNHYAESFLNIFQPVFAVATIPLLAARAARQRAKPSPEITRIATTANPPVTWLSTIVTLIIGCACASLTKPPERKSPAARVPPVSKMLDSDFRSFIFLTYCQCEQNVHQTVEKEWKTENGLFTPGSFSVSWVFTPFAAFLSVGFNLLCIKWLDHPQNVRDPTLPQNIIKS